MEINAKLKKKKSVSLGPDTHLSHLPLREFPVCQVKRLQTNSLGAQQGLFCKIVTRYKHLS